MQGQDFVAYFVRHGQTDWNAEARLQGQVDTELNATGRAQARGNGRTLAGLIRQPSHFRFVSSPLKRTRHTMEIIREAMGLEATGYETDPLLMELSFGAWQGYTLAELEAREPGSTAPRLADKWNFLPPGADAESYAQLAERVRPWFAGLGHDTVCVTHGGVIRSLFRLTGIMGEAEASAFEVPQDRILRYREGRLDWL